MREILHLALFAFAMLVSGVSHAQAANDLSDDESVLEQSLSAADQAELRAILELQPAAGMSPQQLTDFYWKQSLAAMRLGDGAKELEILPKWLASAGNDVKLQMPPTWMLWRSNMRSGDVAAGIAYAERLLPLVPANMGNYRIRLLASLAKNYADLMNLPRADELLQNAQSEFDAEMRQPTQPRRDYFRARSEATILSARNWILARRGKHADAEVVARQGLVAATKLVDLQRFVSEKEAGLTPKMQTVAAYEDLMRTQIDQGHLIDAAVTAQTLLRFCREQKISGNNLNGTYLRISSLKLAQNDVRRAEFYARVVIKETQTAGSQYFSRPAIYAHHRLIDLLIIKRAWAEALTLQTQLDNGVAGNDVMSRIALRPPVRGLILAYAGQSQAAQNLLRRNAEQHASQFGARHIDTILANGLYAIALAKGGQKNAALPLFAAAMRDLHAPDIVGGEVSEQGLQRALRLLILEEYIALLAERAAVGDGIDEAFRATEFLRGSVVQQSVVDSAVRAAAGVSGLGELVRAQQDMKNEVTVLQTFLARQLSEPAQRQLPGVVDQIRKRIATLQAELAARHRDITARFPEYDALIHPQPPSVAGIRKRLGPNEAFISIVPTSTQVVVLAVSAQSASFAVAGTSPAQLDELVKRLRATLDIGEMRAGSAPRFDADAAFRIQDALLAPVAQVWKGKSQLSVAAGGSPGQIPFAVLLTAAPASGTKIDDAWLRKAPWLVSQASISHVPSASSWAALRDTARMAKGGATASKPFYGFGDPLFSTAQASNSGVTRTAGTTRKVVITRSGGADADLVSSAQYDRLPPLPETRDEIVAIAKALGADPQRDTVFGKEASRKNVMATDLSKHKVIVFATHGLVAGDLPNLSQPALALAATGNDAESPLLTLEDVLRLKLDADWIVLSACNTAAADGQAGEAISGLGRGFFYAGAKALLVTHWAVETESAMELTTATFRRFGADLALPRAEALRQAQLGMIASKDHAHPFFWAPYALIGDGGR
jgi:CHAT domain-containing protein